MKKVKPHKIISSWTQITIVPDKAINTVLYFQSTLEINLYDEDPLKYDNLIYTVMFDISSLTVGKKEAKEFIIEPQVKISKSYRYIVPLQHTCMIVQL